MMKHVRAGSLCVLVAAAAMTATGVSAVEQLSRRDAARLQAKIEKINKNVMASRTAAPLKTPVTETEVNSYLAYELADRIPAGVKEPRVSILGDGGHLQGTATVDLSVVAKSHKSSGGMLDPYSYMTGTVPITANGVLRTKNGVATFALDSASVSGVPVPTWMLQEIVSYYSKSPSSPQGVAIDKPFPLPAGIKEIQLAPGQAVVVQ